MPGLPPAGQSLFACAQKVTKNALEVIRQNSLRAKGAPFGQPPEVSLEEVVHGTLLRSCWFISRLREMPIAIF